MEGGYSQDVGSSEPQNFSQNSAWMMGSTSLPQFQTHGPSLKSSASQGVVNNFHSSPYARLPYSDSELQELGYQPPTQSVLQDQHFSMSHNFLQSRFSSQSEVMKDFETNVLLEVKKEGEVKVVPKKRGRGPTKPKVGENRVKKTKVASIEATKKKVEVERKETLLEEGEEDNNDENLLWKEDEVETLIAVRGELAEEFSKAAKKQGQNAWLKVEVRMAASLRGCARTAIACKKKYGSILTQYKNDKRLDEVSGNGRHQHSKWFEHMDLWNGTRASVTNQIPASAQESTLESPTPQKNSQTCEKKTKVDRLEGFLESVVKNSTYMIESFKATSSLLTMMEAHMAALVQKF